MRSLGDQVLSEPLVTIRDGRLVLPVKTQRRSSVPDIVHDQSASGQTLFVEPKACVEAANSVRSLEISKRKEVERLLRDLTSDVHTNLPRLESNLLALGILDRL
jgi:DNA mismatch repair protein MutS2